MYLDRFHRRLAELSELGSLEIDDVEPCVEEDLVALGEKLGVHLPGVIRELYLWGGKCFGEVFADMVVLDFQDHMKHDDRPEARETLEEDGEDPAMVDAQTLIVAMDYDGQFSFVRTDQGDDPAVYTHNAQGPTFCSCERYSDYLALVVEQKAGIEEIELVKSVKALGRLAERQPHSVQHVLFSGGIQFATIPEEVFALKELRSLNLVGKGLIELSPRIGELAFLKRLDLARNSLTSLPMALKELDELEELDLADNQLNSVISVLGKLPALRYCWLTGNPLSLEEINQMQSELSHLEIIFAQP